MSVLRFVSANLRLLVLLLALATLSYCSNSTKENTTTTAQPEQPINTEALKAKLEETLVELPSPIEVVSHVRNANLSYDKAIANDPKAYENYKTTEYTTAVNLGVYMTDLGYACLYTQSQDAIDLISSCKALTLNLGLLELFDPNMTDRFETNLTERDSLLQIIREAFYHTDDYLDKNERNDITVMVTCGTWLEGMYITTQLLKSQGVTDETESVVSRVGEQRENLSRLVSLLEELRSHPLRDQLLADFKALEEKYAGITIVEPATPIPEDSVIDITDVADLTDLTDLVVESDVSVINVPAETLEAITAELARIRTAVVN